MNRLTSKKAGIKAMPAVIALIFAMGQPCAFAADAASSANNSSTNIQSKIMSSVKHVENFYNAFGVCYTSTENSTTVTKTTSTSDSNGKTKSNESTTTQESFVTQSWKGGSLKVDYSTSTSKTNGTDGSSSVTKSDVNYVYDESGKLVSASGTATTTGTLASDAYDGSGGSYTSKQTTSYIIKNAQALPSQTVTDTTTKVEDQDKSTSHEVTDFTYELIGGTWHLMQEVSNSSTTMKDGGSEQRTTTKTYSRDANGVCTGITQEVTGTSVSVDDNDGTWTYNITNYKATFAKDDTLGYYLASESYDLVLESDASDSSTTGAQDPSSDDGSGEEE